MQNSQSTNTAVPIQKLEVSIVTSVYQRRIPFEYRDVKIK